MPPKAYVTLELDDKGTMRVKQFGKEVERVGNKVEKDAGKMKAAWSTLGKAMAVAGTAYAFKSFAEGAVNMAKMGAETENVSRAFRNLSGADSLLNKLKSASKSAIPELELMRQSLIGIDLGATNEQMEIFARYARMESVRKGTDQLTTLKEIMGGVLRGSTELLDNFGVSLTQVNRKIEELALASGTTASKLSQVERRTLMVTAATDIMAKRMKEAGEIGITDAEKIGQAAAQWDELARTFSMLVDTPVADFFTQITQGLKNTTEQLNILQESGLKGWIEEGVIESDIGFIQDWLDSLEKRSRKNNFDFRVEEVVEPIHPALKNKPSADGTGVIKPQWPRLGFAALPGWDPSIRTPRGPKQREKDTRSFFEKMDEEGIQKLIPEMEMVEDQFQVTFSQGEQFALAMTNSVGQAFMGLGAQVSAEFSGLWSRVFNTGNSMFGRLAASFLNSFTSSIVNAGAQMAAGWAMNMILPGSGALLGLMGFAGGGSVSSNKPVMVGERGPEVFVPTTAGHIVPNHQISFNDSIQATGFLPEEILSAINRKRTVQRDEIVAIIKDIRTKNRLEI